MKKVITLIATAAMLAVSCQKEIAPESGDNASATGKLTATIVKTKVSYTETSEKNLQPAWEIGDKIIGFDDAGNTYTLTVASVEAETATLSGTVPDGALHLIYKSGAKASDISSKTLAIDYTNQTGDKTMPAVMLADGTVEDGACDFAFTNAGAIVGIIAANGVPSGSKITKITISGENLSAATVPLSGSALALTATVKGDDAISVDGLNLTVSDANGTLSSPVFIAVPAGATIAKVSATVTREPETMKVPSTADDYVEIAAMYDGTNVTTKKWAKWNVGANSQTDYGWYFAWGGTEGYVYKNSKWVSASGIDTYSYSLSSAKTAGAGDYLYVKTQSFIGHSFNWVNTPYQSQNTETYNSVRFIKYLGGTSSSFKDPSATDEDASKKALDLEDDAANVNWGGSWRIPTSTESQAMKDATYWAWDETDKGCYVYTPNPATDAGKFNDGIGTYSKANALLFFPAAGYGNNDDIVEGGYYWLRNGISSFLATDAKGFRFNTSNFVSGSYFNRRNGFSVRPVLD